MQAVLIALGGGFVLGIFFGQKVKNAVLGVWSWIRNKL